MREHVNLGPMHPPFCCVFGVFGLHCQHGHGLVMDFELLHGLVRLTIVCASACACVCVCVRAHVCVCVHVCV